MLLLVPLLSICLTPLFILFLYWYTYLRKIFFYTESTLDHATHLWIEGTLKDVHEIVDLENKSKYLKLSESDKEKSRTQPLLTFEYRFISFTFNYIKQIFEPIRFNTDLAY
jgi:hypothetical protein